MVFLLMEAAMARREQGRLSEQPGRVGEDPPEQGGWRYEDPPEDAVLLTRAPVRPRTLVPGGTQMAAENPPQQPDLAADLFELQHRIPGLKRHRAPQCIWTSIWTMLSKGYSLSHRAPQVEEQQEPELRLGFCGVGMTGKGARGHASDFRTSTQSHPPNNRAPSGQHSRTDRRCILEKGGTENRQGTPHTPPG